MVSESSTKQAKLERIPFGKKFCLPNKQMSIYVIKISTAGSNLGKISIARRLIKDWLE